VKQLHPALKVILGIILIVLVMNVYTHSTPERLIEARARGARTVFEANFAEGKLIIRELQSKNPTLLEYRIYYLTQRYGLWRINISSADFLFNDGTGRITAGRLPNYPDQSKFVVWGGILNSEVDAVQLRGNTNEYTIPVDSDTGLFVLLNVDAAEFSGSEDSLFDRLFPIYS
jgi:hypothetical protein